MKIEHDQCSFCQKFDIIKDFLKNYGKSFITHEMLSDNQIVFGNSIGEILILNKQFEIKKKLLLETPEKEPVENIIRWKEGFLASG